MVDLRRLQRGVRRVVRPRPPNWLATSPWFDAAWYAERYPDVADSGLDPLTHYWRYGLIECRAPGPSFDALRYEAMNPAARGQALRHYHRHHHVGMRGAVRDGAPQPDEVRVDRHRELACGMFDGRWYTHRHPDAAAEQHPFAAYYRSVLAHRLTGAPLHDPSPLFDTVAYVRHYRLARLASTPLAHYASRRSRVRRLIHRPTMRAPQGVEDRGRLLRPRVNGRHRQRVCVMIHAYYVDLLPELLRSIAPIGRRATVLVSVCDVADVRAAKRAINSVMGRMTRRTVRVVPNRGRNFAPLLCTFGDAIKRHRLLLHLHTKKSLYSGDERVDWREHLLHSLAGPSLPAVLDIFAQHPEVGVLQPGLFEVMPSWSAHWLGNAPHGRAVFARCGLDPADVDGYVDYPVGGMFWARVDAIRPLLDAGLTIDDFDLEDGQTDCTLAHAIERCITSVSTASGFQFVEFDYNAAEWRLNWAGRNTDRFGDVDREHLRQQLEIADLVSVDVFDTLVLRPSLSPTSLQYFAARRVVHDADEAEALVARRIAAEHQARVHHQSVGDVTLAEVFAEMEAIDGPLQAEEIAIESRVAIPRQWLIDELRAARSANPLKRFVVMTDTTLERDTVEALLRQVGAHDLFDEFYVSNERRQRKDVGGMWPLVAGAEGVPAERWLHIGDNERSDIQQALTHRLLWAHIPAPRAVAQFFAPGTHLERGNWSTMAALGLSATALYGGTPIDDADDAFGYGVLGPVLAAFVSRLARHHRDHPEQRMLMMARDTGTLFDAMEALRPLAPDVVPAADYFLVSRRAAIGTSMAAGFDAALLLDGGAFDGRIDDLVEARTNLRPDSSRYHARVSHPAERERVEEVLAPLAEELQTHGTSMLAGLQRVLRSLNIAAETPLCLVDLGYSATTQRALARVLPNPLHGLYGVTTPAARNAMTPNSTVEGIFGEGVGFWTGNWFLDNSLLLEALLSSSHGAVLGYSPDAPEPVLTGEPRQTDVERVARVQAAAIRYCTDLVAMHGPAVLSDVIDPTAVLHWVSRVPERFLSRPMAVFDGMQIENGFIGRDDDLAALA